MNALKIYEAAQSPRTLEVSNCRFLICPDQTAGAIS